MINETRRKKQHFKNLVRKAKQQSETTEKEASKPKIDEVLREKNFTRHVKQSFTLMEDLAIHFKAKTFSIEKKTTEVGTENLNPELLLTTLQTNNEEIKKLLQDTTSVKVDDVFQASFDNEFIIQNFLFSEFVFDKRTSNLLSLLGQDYAEMQEHLLNSLSPEKFTTMFTEKDESDNTSNKKHKNGMKEDEKIIRFKVSELPPEEQKIAKEFRMGETISRVEKRFITDTIRHKDNYHPQTLEYVHNERVKAREKIGEVEFRVKMVNEKDFRFSRLDSTYGGMNKPAAEWLGLYYPWKRETVLVSKDLTPMGKEGTRKHEETEAIIMMFTGLNYPEAHDLTNKIDRIHGNTF